MADLWVYILVWGLVIGCLPAVAVWNHTSGKWYVKLLATIVALGLIGLLVGPIMYLGDKEAVETWNDGYCRNCGERLEFRNGSKYHGVTTYYYICPGCDSVVETGRH